MLDKYTDEEIYKSAMERYGKDEEKRKKVSAWSVPLMRAMLEVLSDSGMSLERLPKDQRERNSDDFHRLWTATLSSSGYNKKSWNDVLGQLTSAGVI